jgi:hypothetical protein
MSKIDKKELDILENIKKFGKNLENLDEKIRIIKSISNDDYYKNILNHSSRSLYKNSKRNEIINKYVNELYKDNDKIYKFQTKIEDKLKDSNLIININDKINITTNSNYNFKIINNKELNSTILDLDKSINDIIKKKKLNNILFFNDKTFILDNLKKKIIDRSFNTSPRIINDDNDKLDLLNYNLDIIIKNAEIIEEFNKKEFNENIKIGGNKFNINIETNFFMLKSEIINVLDTYNNLSKYNQIIKKEKELINKIEYYEYIFLYYKVLITNKDFIKDVTTANKIFNFLTLDNSLLDELKEKYYENKTIKSLFDKYKFEKDKIYLALTNNLDLAYLRGFIIKNINK